MVINDTPIAERCAGELLNVVPVIMRHIRMEMRKSRGYDMTVPQFRTLAYLSSNEGASLTDLAEYIGLTLPSVSKMVDLLVARELVQRSTCVQDRRRVKLSLTGSGRVAWSIAYQAAKAYLVQKLVQLPDTDQEMVERAMKGIKPLFIKEIF
jgi:DNA-binding MarR family transcriptional regulator